ncbi:MAG TPA: 6-phosphogluconolactonase [Vicinamibacterales bacterium]|nr:6-phosphogluconolactonase [Vicinamibacterales bacterium]
MQIVVAGVDALGAEIAVEFERLVQADTLSCALTGGPAGMIVLGALRSARPDWTRVSLYWAEERAVPPEHPGSSFGLAYRMLLAPLDRPGPRVFPMPAAQPDLERAAEDYDGLLEHELGGGPLDLAILGVGEDGHVAGLFPRHPALAATTRVVAVSDAPRPPVRRLTLSLAYLAGSARLWFVAVGERKRSLVQAAVRRAGGDTPFERLVREAADVTIFTDQSVRR